MSLGDILGPEFDAAPALLFGPGPVPPLRRRLRRSWRRAAAVDASPRSDLLPEDEALPEPLRGEGILPVAAAAVRAARTPGTEVDGTEVGGARRGLRGRWVELRHRRRRPATDAESPEQHEEPGRVGARPPDAGRPRRQKRLCRLSGWCCQCVRSVAAR